MISVIRNKDGTIKTFSQTSDQDAVLAEGEAYEVVNTSFHEYASRLILSCAGRSGETLRVARGSGDLVVEVTCPNQTLVAIDINGSVETLPLVNGRAALLLGTEEAGVFVLKPADEAKYCAAGQSVLVIEVV